MQNILDYIKNNGLNAKDLQEELRFRAIGDSELREAGFTKGPLGSGVFDGYSTSTLEDALQTLVEAAHEFEMMER